MLALLLANAGYFVWTQGWLAPYGLAPARQSEPERLAQQIRPEAMQLLAEAPAPPVKSASQPAEPVQTPPVAAPLPAPQVQCLQTGPFTEKQVTALDRRLQAAALPSGSWVFESPPGAVRWIIYLGRYISEEALGRRRDRLKQLGLPFETPVSAQLRPGLSLGGFGSREEAENALAQLSDRGLRSAKVVAERPEAASQWLKFPAADASLRARLESLKPALVTGRCSRANRRDGVRARIGNRYLLLF